jgi:hypothetical protein
MNKYLMYKSEKSEPEANVYLIRGYRIRRGKNGGKGRVEEKKQGERRLVMRWRRETVASSLEPAVEVEVVEVRRRMRRRQAMDRAG